MTTLTWHPKKKKRLKKHGFRRLMTQKGGRKTLKRRRLKRRHRLTVSVHRK